MVPNLYSYLSYEEVRSLLKKNKKNMFLRLEVAYKNPATKRSLIYLNKLSKIDDSNISKLAKQYYFFRLLKRKNIDEIIEYGNKILSNDNDDHIRFVLSLINSFGNREFLSENIYLYLMILYHINAEDIDLAYSYEKSKYADAVFIYALYSTLHGKNFNKIYNLQDQEGVRNYISLKERETLSLIQNNRFIKLEEFISWKNIRGSYPTIRKMEKSKRKEIISSLIKKECIRIGNNFIELLSGGFFLLSCFNI